MVHIHSPEPLSDDCLWSHRTRHPGHALKDENPSTADGGPHIP